jgi:hypothetical protein
LVDPRLYAVKVDGRHFDLEAAVLLAQPPIHTVPKSSQFPEFLGSNRDIETYGLYFPLPLSGFVIDNGVCPPSNPAGTFPCACCPFWPRPPVFPLPEAGPRPLRIFLLYAPVLSDSEERMDAHRCWAGTTSGAAVEDLGESERSEKARRMACNRGGIVWL